jgi:CDP-6-deoxy-D-xylo-4-hexulose-3-dehydrase
MTAIQDRTKQGRTQTVAPPRLDWPLMRENITRDDLEAVREFLAGPEPPILTQSSQVAAFEREWSEWLGVRYSVMVNSGSSANLLTLAALRWAHGPGEIIVPPLTWVSDIAAVLQNGFEPVFVDIDPRTLGMDNRQVLDRLTSRTRGVFITHVLGYNALTVELIEELRARGIPLVEDVCESHGATITWPARSLVPTLRMGTPARPLCGPKPVEVCESGATPRDAERPAVRSHAERGNGEGRGNEERKLGTFGLMSNFSFYFAHHMSTIEGGMISTDDADMYQRLRMLRSHGMVRESTDEGLRGSFAELFPDLNPDFIFAWPAYNCRSTEINAVIGRSQLKRLDENNQRRRRNLELFLAGLDPRRYVTDFATEGSCNYAFTLLLREPNDALRDNVVTALRTAGVEFRRGMSGGGNQLRQPYLKPHVQHLDLRDFPHVEHVHFYGFYIGNYPSLSGSDIKWLCALLNGVPDS